MTTTVPTGTDDPAGPRRGDRRVDIVLDFACVHSYLGFTRLLRAARRYREDGGRIEIGFRPFQLRPDAPTEGEPLFELHKRDRGEAVARQIAADTTIGAHDGLDIRLDRAVFTNTFEAHRLLAQAVEQNRGEEMAERLFRAYFTDGAHIADPDTLARLATEVGVVLTEGGRTELRAELERVRQWGFRSVPVFLVDGGPVLEGERSEQALLAAIAG